MKEKDLYDITEVCRMLNTTSRTLRFYEEKGIIASTASPSSRRHYTKEQVESIKNVLVLRALGLSVKSISELRRENTDLKDLLILKRAEIEALIETKQKELILLTKAMCMMDNDESIFENELDPPTAVGNPRIEAIIKRCNKSVVGGDPDALYEHLSAKMKEYMPVAVFRKIREDTFMPLGNFVSYDRLEYNKKYPHIVCQYAKYEKLGLKIKYVFYGEVIEGFWVGYYEI